MNDELYEELEIAEAALDKIEEEFRDNCTLYGNAWPGALDQVDRCLATVNELRKKLGMMDATSNCASFVR